MLLWRSGHAPLVAELRQQEPTPLDRGNRVHDLLLAGPALGLQVSGRVSLLAEQSDQGVGCQELSDQLLALGLDLLLLGLERALRAHGLRERLQRTDGLFAHLEHTIPELLALGRPARL